MDAVVSGMSSQRLVFRVGGLYHVEVALHHCIHPFLIDQDKNLFCEAAGSCPSVPPDVHVIMAVIKW